LYAYKFLSGVSTTLKTPWWSIFDWRMVSQLFRMSSLVSLKQKQTLLAL